MHTSLPLNDVDFEMAILEAVTIHEISYGGIYGHQIRGQSGGSSPHYGSFKLSFCPTRQLLLIRGSASGPILIPSSNIKSMTFDTTVK